MSKIAYSGHHPAVEAWKKVAPKTKYPINIEVLKDKHKVKVYRLAGLGPDNQDVIAKGGLSDKLSLERTFYQRILPNLSLPTLDCYGYLQNDERGFSWLFLEDARGEPFDKMNKRHWAAAEEWLGALHLCTLADDEINILPRRELTTFYDLLLKSHTHISDYLDSTQVGPNQFPVLQETLSNLDKAALKWEDITRVCASVPPSIIHGDLKVKNVSIRQEGSKIAFIPFDWEMGGWGPSVIDLGVVYLESPEKELKTYWSLLKHLPAYQNPEDFRQFLYIGGILRLIISTYWAGQSLRAGYIVRLIGKLRAYNHSFSEIFKVLN